MAFQGSDLRRATASRDAAIARLRRGTAVAAGACVALTAAFAGLAAGFTSGRHAASTTRPVRRVTASPVVAPAPALVPVGSAATSSEGSQSSSPPPVAAPPPSAAPVVVSGGS